MIRRRSTRRSIALVAALEQIDRWQANHAAVGVVSSEGVLATHGDTRRRFRWASVTKLLTAAAALVAVEEGVLDLDEPAGPEGATVRHLLAHASGLPFDGEEPIARPGARGGSTRTPATSFLRSWWPSGRKCPSPPICSGALLEPLGMRDTVLEGSPASHAAGSLDDLLVFARDLLAPSFVAPETLAEATEIAVSRPRGGASRLRSPGARSTGASGSSSGTPSGRIGRARATLLARFGHFGGSGTFLWVDPDAALACACLTDREFGDWALEAWPALSDAVLAEFAHRQAAPI